MQQITNDESITYLSPRWDAGVNFEKRNKTSTDIIEYRHTIYGGSGAVAIYTVANNTNTNTNTKTLRYLHKDHLGSIEAITNETGALVERLSYDAFGKRRNKNGTDGTPSVLTTSYGYTSHEMVDAVGVIHMNGRVYDPSLGRFMQADPIIQAPLNSQSLNRYSYVMNNPLTLVDPSGYGWLSKAWKKVYRASGMKAFVDLNRAAWNNPYVRMAGGIVAGGVLMGTCGPLCAGFVQGFISSGGNLKAAVIGGISAGVFSAAGSVIGNTQSWTAANVASNVGRMAAEGMVGGAMSAAQGGSFRDGFVSGAIAKGGEGWIMGIQGSDSSVIIQRSLIAASAGGLGSQLAGGSFKQGFYTAAFAHLYNGERHNWHEKKGKLDRSGDVDQTGRKGKTGAGISGPYEGAPDTMQDKVVDNIVDYVVEKAIGLGGLVTGSPLATFVGGMIYSKPLNEGEMEELQKYEQ